MSSKKLILHWLAKPALTILSYVLSPFFAMIAKTGYGADICLKYGFLPLPVHYYSPVPDIPALQERRYWSRGEKFDLPGIQFDQERQLSLVKELGERFGKECVWPANPGSDGQGYYFDNPSFGYSSACLLHSMIRHYRPARVIEIGSGFSTLITAAALMANSRDYNQESEFIAIEPFPGSQLRRKMAGLTQLLPKRVEEVPLSLFESLGENDLLFIDSSHVVRINGDVNLLYLNVLPRLHPGVIVHIHDIQLPYDYPEVYFTGRKKYFWTEQYLLQAFLIENHTWETLLSAYWIGKEFSKVFSEAFQHYDPVLHRPSTSFYMRRVR